VLAAAALFNACVVVYEKSRGRALGSPFLMADAAHTGSDVYVTLLAITSLLLAAVGRGSYDAPLAILVALLIARNGYSILRQSVPILVDERAVDPARVRELLGTVPSVRAVRVVRTRATAAGRLFAEVTIAVEAEISVAEAHAVADEVEARIRADLGAAEVTVHVEPI